MSQRYQRLHDRIGVFLCAERPLSPEHLGGGGSLHSSMVDGSAGLWGGAARDGSGGTVQFFGLACGQAKQFDDGALEYKKLGRNGSRFDKVIGESQTC